MQPRTAETMTLCKDTRFPGILIPGPGTPSPKMLGFEADGASRIFTHLRFRRLHVLHRFCACVAIYRSKRSERAEPASERHARSSSPAADLHYRAARCSQSLQSRYSSGFGELCGRAGELKTVVIAVDFLRFSRVGVGLREQFLSRAINLWVWQGVGHFAFGFLC